MKHVDMVVSAETATAMRLRQMEEEIRFHAGRRWLRHWEIANALPTLGLIVRDGGIRESPAYRARWFAPTRVSWAAAKRRWPAGKVILPFGWIAWPEVNSTGRRDEKLVGPWWMFGWHWLSYVAYYRFCMWATSVDLARAPNEGCYLHELVWFPDMPRFK